MRQKGEDDEDGKEEEGVKEGAGNEGGVAHHKLQQDMELVLAALVDFRREMKVLNKKVQQLTDSDGHIQHHTHTKHHPGFVE